MNDFNYCQLDVNNICTGVSQLCDDVPEYNYDTPQVFNPITGLFENGVQSFVSRMKKVDIYSTAYIGLHWNDTTNLWEKVV